MPAPLPSLENPRRTLGGDGAGGPLSVLRGHTPKGVFVLPGTGAPFPSRDLSRHAEGWPHAGRRLWQQERHPCWWPLQRARPLGRALALSTMVAGISASSPSLPAQSSPAHLQDDLRARKLLLAEPVLVNAWT